MNLCFFQTPWFPEGESDRLLIAPVKDRDALKACFDLILIPDIALGMEFPPQLTWRQFEDKYFRSPRKDVFLLMDKASRKLAGFVILWPVQGKKNWHQILYGIRPEYRGRGLALEGCQQILTLMARHRISEGVTAIVNTSNQASEGVVRGLGMVRMSMSTRCWWERPLSPP